MSATTGSGVGGPPVTGRPEIRGVDVAAEARRQDMIAAFAGIAVIAVFIAQLFTPDVPAASRSADAIISGLVADRSGHQLSIFLGLLGDVAFVVFLAGLWSRFRRSEGTAGMFATLFLIGSTAFVATILIGEGVYLTLVQAAGEIAEPSGVLALAMLNEWAGVGFVPAAVAMLVGAACVIAMTRTLPVWLAWLAALTAVLTLVSALAVFQSTLDSGVAGIIGFIGFVLLLVWLLATSLTLLVRAGRDVRGAA